MSQGVKDFGLMFTVFDSSFRGCPKILLIVFKDICETNCVQNWIKGAETAATVFTGVPMQRDLKRRYVVVQSNS